MCSFHILSKLAKRLQFLFSGIDIQEIPLQRKVGSTVFNFRVWDFAGQEDYYATHQCFLSERSLFLLSFDLRDPIETLRPWLDNLSARVPSSYVIIVGTMLDLVKCNDVIQYETKMASKVLNLIRSESTYRKINFEGLVCISSIVTFTEYSRSEYLFTTNIFICNSATKSLKSLTMPMLKLTYTRFY